MKYLYMLASIVLMIMGFAQIFAYGDFKQAVSFFGFSMAAHAYARTIDLEQRFNGLIQTR
jgi:hypothetical protein